MERDRVTVRRHRGFAGREPGLAARTRLRRSCARRADRRANDLPLGVDHQDAHRRSRSCSSAIAASSRSTISVTRRTSPSCGWCTIRTAEWTAITIRMLLSHAAGFQNPTWPWSQGKIVGAVRADDVESARRDDAISGAPFKPGTTYSYSNPGFIYLARVIEQLSGDPWETYVQKNIFAPLGLTAATSARRRTISPPTGRISYYVRCRLRDRQATRSRQRRRLRPGITIPNGAWNAPLGDLSIWLSFLTNATHGNPTPSGVMTRC